ncbi:CPBP family intramembrane glutamic endopeptidase [Bariatricus sp. SGI.154]|uniref:CPBP family intramembrane glutamic endopeptidase n=1 Tax=Bariatricus sp. SGI.154 TaxID=3420549 RepID=UPI003D07B052
MKKKINMDARRIIFFMVAYLVPWLFVPWIKPGMMSLAFGEYIMTLPTSGVILGQWYINKGKKRDFFQKIFIVGSCCCSLYIFICIAGIVKEEYMNIWNRSLFAVFSLLLFFYCLLYGGESLYPFKNQKKMAIIVGALIVIKGIYLAVFGVNFNCGKYIIAQVYGIPSIMALSCFNFLGEEFAWRGYLQKRLQSCVGKRMGVIILGIIWELWHIPLWVTTFQLNRQEAGLGIMIVARFINVIGLAIFLGWVYMKTENVWLCALLHGMNNATLTGVADGILEVHGIPIGAIIQPVILWMFIFSKEYRKESSVTQYGGRQKTEVV